jgi:hypothetical protein
LASYLTLVRFFFFLLHVLDHWSPVAVAAATKIFASNLNAKMAQRFYNLILLPHVRNDMEQNKKLNWHLYMALKKSVFKPAAFYKGIVLPLCEVMTLPFLSPRMWPAIDVADTRALAAHVQARNCTLREATIVASIIVKVSIPALQSAVALLKIAQMDYSGTISSFRLSLISLRSSSSQSFAHLYAWSFVCMRLCSSGANSIFIRVLLDKKYSLPYRVIDALVDHFVGFMKEERQLPVLWHQALLVFVQRFASRPASPMLNSGDGDPMLILQCVRSFVQIQGGHDAQPKGAGEAAHQASDSPHHHRRDRARAQRVQEPRRSARQRRQYPTPSPPSPRSSTNSLLASSSFSLFIRNGCVDVMRAQGHPSQELNINK